MQLLNCTLINFTIISVYFDDISQFDYKKLTLRNGEISILIEDFKIKNNEVILYLKSDINIKLTCTITYENSSLSVSYFSFYSSEEFNSKFYTEEVLGLNYSKDSSIFTLWSPVASFVNLLIYEDGDNSIPEKPKKFKLIESNGLWKVTVKGNLKGYFYTYEIKVNGKINEVVDPYARACGINGLRGAIIDLKETNPPGFLSKSGPPIERYTDAIIYEVNVRDLSIHPDSGTRFKGKYLGLAEDKTQSSKDITTGLAHIKELGITHVQLMPIFDYSHESVDEKHPYKYNWGYDPQNYNIPEGTYSTDPHNPKSRIHELKKAIRELHKNGIGVIMDVAYNHVYKYEESNFEKIFPGYYFRQFTDGTYCNGSGCGNDFASERSMARKFIVDSIMYWASEYLMDGFRFDLMGIHDTDTMYVISEKLNATGKKYLLYGEGWVMTTNLMDNRKANVYNSSSIKDIAFFNDTIRDVIKGSVFNAGERGFVSARIGQEDTVKFCVSGSVLNYFYRKPLFTSPEQSINYSSCHDNHALWDKLKLSCPEASDNELADMSKLADGIIITSVGTPFIHAGSEFCRTKNGVENSYNSTDTINRMDWFRKYKFMKVFEYYKGLIKLRKEHSAFRMFDREQVQKHLEFLTSPSNTVAFLIKDHANGDAWKDVLVIYNSSKYPMDISIPEGFWNVIVDKNTAGTNIIHQISGSSITVEPISMKILYKN